MLGYVALIKSDQNYMTKYGGWDISAYNNCGLHAICKEMQKCQIHGDYTYQPPTYLHPTFVSWPFEA